MFPFSPVCSSFLLSLSTFSLVLGNYLLQRKGKKKGRGDKGRLRRVGERGGCRSFSLFQNSAAAHHKLILQNDTTDLVSVCNLAPTVETSGCEPWLLESATSTKPHQAL